MGLGFIIRITKWYQIYAFGTILVEVAIVITWAWSRVKADGSHNYIPPLRLPTQGSVRRGYIHAGVTIIKYSVTGLSET